MGDKTRRFVGLSGVVRESRAGGAAVRHRACKEAGKDAASETPTSETNLPNPLSVMKKQLFSLALILGLASSFAADTFAADVKEKDRREVRQDGRKDHKKGHQDAAQRQQQRLDRMTKELDLSKKQQEKVAKIFQDQQQQMQQLRGRQQGTDRSKQMAEFKQIHERTDKQLKDVLSKKQYAQLEAQRQERLKQLQQRRSQHDGRRGDFKQGRS